MDHQDLFHKCPFFAFSTRGPFQSPLVDISFQQGLRAMLVPREFAINHAGVQIENVDEFRYLGFTTSLFQRLAKKQNRNMLAKNINSRRTSSKERRASSRRNKGMA
jgi:hypothetical protein